MKKRILLPLLLMLTMVGCEQPPEPLEEYTLSFSANGGTGTMVSETHEETSEFNLSACSFTKDRYEFIGWATSREGAVAYQDEALFTMPSQNTTLYAKWQHAGYYINFDANGGEGTMDPVLVKQGTSYTLPKGTFTKEDYALVGWATTRTGSKMYDDEGEYVMGNEDITLYAVYQHLGYIVTYDANGGEGTMPSERHPGYEGFVLPEATFTKEGYVVAKWATSPDATSGYLPGKTFYMPGRNVTLYAIWISNAVTISFKKNNGSGTDMENIECTMGSRVTLPTCTYYRSGYVFAGWGSSNSAVEPQYLDGETITVPNKSTINLYALWRTVQTVVVHPNTYRTASHDTGADSNKEYTNYTSGSTINNLIEAFGVPSPKDGATFVGYRPVSSTNPSDEILNTWTLPGGNYSTKYNVFAQLINFTNFDRYTEITFDYDSARAADTSVYPKALELDFIVSIHNALDKIVVDWGDGTARENFGTEQFLFDKEDTHYVLHHAFSRDLANGEITIKIAGALDSFAIYREDGVNNVSDGHRYIAAIAMDEDVRFLKPFNGTYGAFENCVSLYYFDGPDALYEIGPRAFKGCTNLEHLYFPTEKQEKPDATNRVMQSAQVFDYGSSSITIIGDEAFAGLTTLHTFYLPMIQVKEKMGHGVFNNFSGKLFINCKPYAAYPSDWLTNNGSNINVTYNVGDQYFKGGTMSTAVSAEYAGAIHVTPGRTIKITKKSGGNMTLIYSNGTTKTISSSSTFTADSFHSFVYLKTASGTTMYEIEYN